MKIRLRGTTRLSVFGASPERCFNRWSSDDLPFWALEKRSDMQYFCTVYSADLQILRREAARAQCELEILGVFGLTTLLSGIRCRPVAFFGLLLTVLLVLHLQGCVWFLRVAGNQRVSTDTILNALEDAGVRFGMRGSDVDSEALKHRMLNELPDLSWFAANRSGGILTILCAEREPELSSEKDEGVANVVALRPGVIREISVINGFSELKPGDTVNAGDVLISGVMEWTTHVQMTHARGEVIADTFRSLELSCPASAWSKTYTGRTEICKTIIFLRKRRKLSGNSGIFGSMCDRMIETNEWTLPGGFSLPVEIETVTLREFVLEPVSISEDEAERLLDAEALRLTESEMIAGTVQTRTVKLRKNEDGYLCFAGLNCSELISGTASVEPFGEDELHGEDHQRGTN